MAKVVQTNSAQSAPFHDALERLAERMLMERLAVLLRDDEILVLVVGSPLSALVVMLAPVLAELADSLGVEVDHSRVVDLGR